MNKMNDNGQSSADDAYFSPFAQGPDLITEKNHEIIE
jgi:hypothetical protein